MEVLIADSGSGLPETAGLNVPVLFTGDIHDLNSAGKELMTHRLIAENPDEIKTKLGLHLGRGTFPKPTESFFSPPANQEVSQYVYSILAK